MISSQNSSPTPKKRKTHAAGKKQKVSKITRSSQTQTRATSKYESWFVEHHMQIRSDLSQKDGNCLFTSVSSLLDNWKGKSFQLRYQSVTWAQNEVKRGSSWGMFMWNHFEHTKHSQDAYGKSNYMEYLEEMKNITTFGTQYDVVMLCEFLCVSIKVYIPELFSERNGTLYCGTPYLHGIERNRCLSLWLCDQHYEPIIEL